MKDDNEKYGIHYSEANFWSKVKRVAVKGGERVIYLALNLYYVLKKEEVPSWVKAVAIGALGYFIFPLDAIPDIAPLVGYADDATMLAAAAWTLTSHIDDDVKAKAKEKMRSWFGDSVDSIPEIEASPEKES